MCKTIKPRVKFKADPATIYGLLADSRKQLVDPDRMQVGQLVALE
jgi:hypothetical protein